MKATILDRIERRAMTPCIIGLGYVGLPLSVEMAQAGFDVIGVDRNAKKVDMLNHGESYVQDVHRSDLQAVIQSGKLRVTTDPEVVRSVDAISICVPTPLRKTKDPDLTYILDAVTTVQKHVKPGAIVVLESTTYPGTTDEILGQAMIRRGLTPGCDVFIAFSPERVDPGNPVYGTKNTPKVIGGVTPLCGEMAAALYRNVVEEVVVVSSARVAEMVKLLENTFRSVNIGLVNEMAMMCDRMGIDVWEVIKAASTKPFGFMPFYPGPGTGGHCIPLDPQYLSWKAKTFNFYNRFIELASDINGNMPRYAVGRISEVLNTRGKCLSQARILVLGAAYKKDINDVRESPSLEIINLLIKSGAQVYYNDPYVPQLSTVAGTMKSSPVDSGTLRDYDCVIVGTDHSDYDMKAICENAKTVFDTRNATRDARGQGVIVMGDGWQVPSGLGKGEAACAAEQER